MANRIWGKATIALRRRPKSGVIGFRDALSLLAEQETIRGFTIGATLEFRKSPEMEIHVALCDTYGANADECCAKLREVFASTESFELIAVFSEPCACSRPRPGSSCVSSKAA